ncbi:MAG TPA: class II histone deacetylase [Dictyobacter sp.]|jgi:acetoin utilization deacetylase AcuC-like enzyme|nr:class II histone deacetylase [Dictyobacter sp.]
MIARRTGLVFDQRFLAHNTGVEAKVVLQNSEFLLTPETHPSSLFITQRIKEFLDGSGLTSHMYAIATRAATEDELARYHSRDYIAGIAACSQGEVPAGVWGEVDEDTILSPGSFEAALYAAGGAMNAVDAVLRGQVTNAYALLRPPGHHATRNQALGFCVFNNAVMAAYHAKQVYGLERILIVDWDVHHGNGIQDAFYEDPEVLFISLHQQNWFPKESGELAQVGVDAGRGYTINIPLPPGTGDRGYLAAFDQIIIPVAESYRPQLIIIASGQDANWLDPLAHMMMTMQGFYTLSQRMVALAERMCQGHLVMLQEGGYSASYVPYCAAATVEPLLGVDLGIVDLYATAHELTQCQTIFSYDTRQALDAARQWHQQWWQL